MAQQVTNVEVKAANYCSLADETQAFSDHNFYVVTLDLKEAEFHCEDIAFSESFSADFGQFTTVNTAGTKEWLINTSYSCANINAYQNGVNDDWLISPPVRGGTTLEFYYGAQVRKAAGVEILYSETGQDISDFKPLKQLVDATGDDWFLAYAKLPETAKYFAIHHNKGTHLGYGLKIDDITYSKITSVDHFNIYVDGRLVGTSAEAAYTIDGPLTVGRHKIAVTAVYADGTETIPAYATLEYADAITEILMSGKPFDVYSTDGKLVRKQTRSVEGLRGVYVIDNKSVILK
jgi:hypothetical protein